MKMGGIIIIAILVVILISLLCIWLLPSIKDFMAYNMLWNGVRRGLDELHASTISSLEEIPAIPENTVLIIVPYLPLTSEDTGRIKAFVNDGGTLLLMDDYGYGNSILESLELDYRLLPGVLKDPLFCYKNPWLPKVTDFSSADAFKDIKSVILNYATIIHSGKKLEYGKSPQVLAWSSSRSFLDQDENGYWTEPEPQGMQPVAVKVSYMKGTVMVMSDPSILINSMIGKADNLLFIKTAIGVDNVSDKQIVMDTSHLATTPLDVVKDTLAKLKHTLSKPYSIMGMLLLVFVIAARFSTRMGGTVERKS